MELSAAVMLIAAFWVLCAAAALGAGLGVRYLAAGRRRLPAAVYAAHAGLGTAGLALILAALGRGLPAGRMGTAGFAPAAAGLLALALAFGLVLAVGWRRRRRPELLVGTHATLAVAALALLLSLLALG
jgi:hypothetical protein